MPGHALLRRLVIEREVGRRRRPPHVERILGRVVAALPVVIDRDVVDVGGIFRVAAPRIAHVVEIVRSQHVAAEAPAGDEALVGHLHGAEPDLVDRRNLPAQVMQAGPSAFTNAITWWSLPWIVCMNAIMSPERSDSRRPSTSP